MPKGKSKQFQPLVGFKKFSFSLPSEEMGKEFREFCATHYLLPQEVIAKVFSDWLIANSIATGQPLPSIEVLERFNRSP